MLRNTLLHYRNLTILFAGLLGGCGKAPPSAPTDLSIPRLPPKPVVWVQDWQAPPEPAEPRKKAQVICSQADSLKSRGEHEQADNLYQEAMAADPSWPYPRYQRACNFQLWDR